MLLLKISMSQAQFSYYYPVMKVVEKVMRTMVWRSVDKAAELSWRCTTDPHSAGSCELSAVTVCVSVPFLSVKHCVQV